MIAREFSFRYASLIRDAFLFYSLRSSLCSAGNLASFLLGFRLRPALVSALVWSSLFSSLLISAYGYLLFSVIHASLHYSCLGSSSLVFLSDTSTPLTPSAATSTVTITSQSLASKSFKKKTCNY